MCMGLLLCDGHVQKGSRSRPDLLAAGRFCCRCQLLCLMCREAIAEQLGPLFIDIGLACHIMN